MKDYISITEQDTEIMLGPFPEQGNVCTNIRQRAAGIIGKDIYPAVGLAMTNGNDEGENLMSIWYVLASDCVE